MELIDYGTEVYTSLKNVRYMVRAMLHKLPAQAIKCRLLFGLEHDTLLEESKAPWPEEAGTLLLKMFMNKSLGVTFVERLTETMSGDPTVGHYNFTIYLLIYLQIKIIC